jgi:hypothetical protein
MDPKVEDFARLLYRNDKAALSDLRSATNDWLAFYKVHARTIGVDLDDLKEDWEDGPEPWELIIDVAILHHWLFESDGREFYDEIISGVRELAPCQSLPIDWDRLSETDLETPINTFLHDTAAALYTHGEILVLLDKASDSLPLALLREEHLAQAKTAVKDLGIGRLLVVCDEEFT